MHSYERYNQRKLKLTLDKFKEKLHICDLNLKAFAQLTNMPYSTVAKYGRSNPMPGWVEPFLNLHHENIQMQHLKQEIKSLAKKL